MPVDGSQDWRQRYLECIAEMDRRESAWVRLEERLRLALREVALCGVGRDPQLDRALDRLRAAMRSPHGRAELTEQSAVIRQRAQGLERDGRLQPLRGHLLRLLDRVQGRAGVRRARQLRARLETVTELEALELAPEVVELCIPAPQAIQPAAPLPREGVFRRLLGGAGRGAPSAGPGDPAPTAGPTKPASVRRLRRSLAGLLRSVLGPGDDEDDGLGQRVDALNAEGLDGLADILDSLAGLAAEVRARLEAERDGLKRFMAALETRLGEMEELMASAERVERDHSRAQVDERRWMHDELAGLDADLARYGDLQALKAAVSRHVDKLGEQLAARRRAEAQRAAALEAQLRSLRERMKIMEGEARQLRERLADARASSREDRLTGVPNRRAWEERLDYEFARWQRHRRPLALVFFDVDHFKLINDRLGHAAGDQALAQIAGRIHRRLRRSDFLARYGGEEFVALLPETTSEEAAQVADAVLQGLREDGFEYDGVDYSVTASAGVAGFTADDGPAAVLKRADQALYLAKSGGRDRVCVAPPEGSIEGEAGQPPAQGADAQGH
ncbi:diguanylate cyclase [Alkalilimnicola ehrlichii MLHE-1]|uniref:diguanylate cyclase n=1 Tax=Alkalilimnicola ehrlichii (strain ATCC BAA-1101 / DSM 17681 / MLHE-1) TaxID=187272 RepID=Q0A595_ALKEH|nr:diguanylate cyclase [Alkalilimnicola ehrlichii]ABI57992.1 diguanylate cyclase [Alkalilimnicola ehrlichii MLHE-1]